jgi:hypothetical protein
MKKLIEFFIKYPVGVDTLLIGIFFFRMGQLQRPEHNVFPFSRVEEYNGYGDLSRCFS